jgi:hypothetical protein
MGLIIKPDSMFKAALSRVYNWANLKAALTRMPFDIAWEDVIDILIIKNDKTPYVVHFKSSEGESVLRFSPEEVQNLEEFEIFLKHNPEKIVPDRLTFFKGHFTSYFKSYIQFSAITSKYILGLLALTFAYFQFRHAGFTLIHRYDFLVKSTCNVECADKVWSISMMFLFLLFTLLSPIIPILFYKRIYRSALRSKNIRIINTTLTEIWLLAFIGILSLAVASPQVIEMTSKYSKIISAYVEGSVQSKFSRKIGLSSRPEPEQ